MKKELKREWRVFAVYTRLKNGIMKLLDLVSMPSYYTSVRTKYKLIALGFFSKDIWVTLH